MTQSVEAFRATVKERAKDALSRYSDRAVQIIAELMEDATNERVRLAAAESILDRTGIGKTQTQEVKVSQVEHEQAKNEAEVLVAKLKKNAVVQAKVMELDTLMVLEGESDELPVASPESNQDVIEVSGADCDQGV